VKSISIAKVVLFSLIAIAIFPRALPAQVTLLSACATIAAPGSYQLSKNLASSSDCLKIAANNVTVDLNGFAISGAGSGRAITDLGTKRTGLIVRGGTLNHFATGVALAASSDINIDHLRVLNMSGDGIDAGPRSVVSYTQSLSNGGVGISVSGSCIVRSNTVGNNQADGIVTGGYCSVRSNNVFNNALALVGNGISTSSYCDIRDNVASKNKNWGIESAGGSNFSDNTASGNGIPGSTPTSGLFGGIFTGQGSTAASNDASYNIGLYGIQGGLNATIADNTASKNRGIGIAVDGNDLLSGDTASSNTAAGFYVFNCPATLIGDIAQGNPNNYSIHNTCPTWDNF
jgi:parallel beta-helix repeat protein